MCIFFSLKRLGDHFWAKFGSGSLVNIGMYLRIMLQTLLNSKLYVVEKQIGFSLLVLFLWSCNKTQRSKSAALENACSSCQAGYPRACRRDFICVDSETKSIMLLLFLLALIISPKGMFLFTCGGWHDLEWSMVLPAVSFRYDLARTMLLRVYSNKSKTL